MNVPGSSHGGSFEQRSVQVLEMHRTIASLKEKLEAIDCCKQRAELCADTGREGVLLSESEAGATERAG